MQMALMRAFLSAFEKESLCRELVLFEQNEVLYLRKQLFELLEMKRLRPIGQGMLRLRMDFDHDTVSANDN